MAEWLTHVRGVAGVAEVRLGPLTRDEMAEQVAGLAGSPVSVSVVDEMYARAEGNPFFTEQLVAAAVTGGCAGPRGRVAGAAGGAAGGSGRSLQRYGPHGVVGAGGGGPAAG